MSATKYSVVGSRGFMDRELFRRVMRELLTPFDEIVSGGCKGSPDEMAEDMAVYMELTRTIIPAKWKLYGRKAGHMRNPEVAERGDKMVALWDGQSAGTLGAMKAANDLGRPLLVVWPDGRRQTRNGF